MINLCVLASGLLDVPRSLHCSRPASAMVTNLQSTGEGAQLARRRNNRRRPQPANIQQIASTSSHFHPHLQPSQQASSTLLTRSL